MQLLKIDKDNYIGQADPYIIEHNGKYYIYTTGDDGLYGYSCDTLLGDWKFEGQIFTISGRTNFWAPSAICLDGKFYIYFSFELDEAEPDQGGHHGAMHVLEGDNPMGPFELKGQIAPPFSIDSHIVKTDAGLFLFYSPNTFEGDRIGTHIVVQKMSDPYTLEGEPKVVLLPSIDEEIFCIAFSTYIYHTASCDGRCLLLRGKRECIYYGASRGLPRGFHQ